MGRTGLGRLGSLSVFSSYHWWFVPTFAHSLAMHHWRGRVAGRISSFLHWFYLDEFVDLNPLHSDGRRATGSRSLQLKEIFFWRSSVDPLLEILLCRSSSGDLLNNFFWRSFLETRFLSRSSSGFLTQNMALTGRWTSSASNPGQDIALSCPIN